MFLYYRSERKSGVPRPVIQIVGGGGERVWLQIVGGWGGGGGGGEEGLACRTYLTERVSESLLVRLSRRR